MTAVNVFFEETKLDAMRQQAQSSGIDVEELIRRSVDEYLQRRKKVDAAMDYLLHKNAELYRRLA